MPVGATVAVAGAGLASGAMASSASKSAGKAVAGATDRAAELEHQRFQQLLALQMPGYNRGEQAAGVLMSALGLPSMTGQGPTSGYGQMSVSGVPGLMTGGRDWNGYLEANPDVRQGIEGGLFGGPSDMLGAAQRHYLEYGQNEGRAAPAATASPTQTIAQQVMQTPGYQAQLDQGIKSIDRAAPLVGGMYSGRRMKALNDYGQQTFGGYYNDWLNRVSGIAGQGQQTAQNVGQAGMQNAANVGGLMVQGANARAQGSMNSANAWSGALGTGVSALGYFGGQAGWFK